MNIDVPKHINTLTEEFKDFLIKTNVAHLIIAFIVGSYVTKLSSNITTVIITPIVSKLTGNNIKNIESFEINIFGVSFKIGKLLYMIFDFLLMMIIIFLIFTKLIRLPTK